MASLYVPGTFISCIFKRGAMKEAVEEATADITPPAGVCLLNPCLASSFLVSSACSSANRFGGNAFVDRDEVRVDSAVVLGGFSQNGTVVWTGFSIVRIWLLSSGV